MGAHGDLWASNISHPSIFHWRAHPGSPYWVAQEWRLTSAFSCVRPDSLLHLQLHLKQSPISLQHQPSPVHTDQLFKEPRALLSDYNAETGGSTGGQREHPTSLILAFFFFTSMSTSPAHFQGQAFLMDHSGGEDRERREWQKSSTSKAVGKPKDIWIHKGQEKIGWGSLAFNSLSAFPGEDDIICSHFDVLYPITFLKVFQCLLLFYQLFLSIPLPGDQHISPYSVAEREICTDRSPTLPANPSDYFHHGPSSTNKVVTAKLNSRRG